MRHTDVEIRKCVNCGKEKIRRGAPLNDTPFATWIKLDRDASLLGEAIHLDFCNYECLKQYIKSGQFVLMEVWKQ